jgi:MHS family shikimate/dehydroshikimate transporter-like MFS transporter
METKEANDSIKQVASASFIGTAIQWYDFFIFNAATALLLFKNPFFANADPNHGMLLIFGTYAIGFLARPIGGLICGNIGDRFGRKKLLVATLLTTGISTVAIGLLPGQRLIGNWAPYLLFLFRFAQGFAVGGEWGAATLMSVEHAPDERRGYYGGWPQMGVPVGLLLSYFMFYVVIAKLPTGLLPFDWWRVRFLLSVVLVGLGIYIRVSVPESPKYQAVADSPSRTPVLDAWRCQKTDVLVAMGAKVAENGVFYVYTVFMVAFAKHANIDLQKILIAISLAAAGMLLTIPIFAFLSDSFGRRRVYLLGAIFAGLFAYPSFWLVSTGRLLGVILAVVPAMTLGWAAMYAPQASFFSELFETRVRYSGASLGSQVATVFAGGVMQIVAVSLLQTTNSYWPVALIMIGMAMLTSIAVGLANETFRKDLYLARDVRAEIVIEAN